MTRFQIANSTLAALRTTATPRAMRDNLAQKVLPDIQNLYNEELTWIRENYCGEGNVARWALSWIARAKRPLTVDELQHVLGINIDDLCLDFDDEMLPSVDDFLNACSGLLEVDEDTRIVDFVHWSAREAFKDRFYSDSESLAKQCIVYLSYACFKDGPCATDKEFEERLEKFPFYDYAANYWAAHAADCYQDHKVNTVVSGFLGFSRISPSVEAAVQALFAKKACVGASKMNYSQNYPRDMSALHLAAYFGLRSPTNYFVRYLPSGPLDLNDSLGRSPLWYAADQGQRVVIEILADLRRFNPNEVDKNGESPVDRALKTGNGRLVGPMFKGGDNWEQGEPRGPPGLGLPAPKPGNGPPRHGPPPPPPTHYGPPLHMGPPPHMGPPSVGGPPPVVPFMSYPPPPPNWDVKRSN
jgi:hypothetical protein